MSNLPQFTKPLSSNMKRALRALVDGRSVADALPGHGRNIDATLVALKTRGLIEFAKAWGVGWEATPAGRALVESWKKKP